MRSARNMLKNKHVTLDQTKLRKAQQILEAKTETETIERALDLVIAEAEKDQQTWFIHERFLKAAAQSNLVIHDVFGRLDGK